MTISYTPWADPLLDYINNDLAATTGGASSPFAPINYNADLFANEAKFFTGNFGFDGYMGVPGLVGSNAQQAAAAYNVAWQSVDPSLNPTIRALTSGVAVFGISALTGVYLQLQDTMPLVFSYPVLPTTLDPDGSDFEVVLSDGSIVAPLVASLAPNLEHNERQTVLLIGDFGNRIEPGSNDSRYPVSVRVVNDNTPLQLLSAQGPVDAVGLEIASQNPYVVGNGPKVVAAKLNYYSPLGEGGPAAVGAASTNNDGADLYGESAQYRLRLYTSAGFSPDGIASLLPGDFGQYFILEAQSSDGSVVQITSAGQSYTIGQDGSLKVIGLADLGSSGTPENDAYVEDKDNYYDIILEGDRDAISRLTSVRMPSGDGYQAVYNPGGPGNAPDAPGAAAGPFTVPSQDHTVPITLDLDGAMTSTYVEIDGPVLRNPWDLLPVGSLLGLAIHDTTSGQRINAYSDPDGQRFYASFAPSSNQATDLAGGLEDRNPIDLIDTTAFAAEGTATVSGSFSRSAPDASTLRFYSVTGEDGGVLDPSSGVELRPGDAGYAAAARSSANLLSSSGSTLKSADQVIESFSFEAEAGKLYAPLITNNTKNEEYFAFAAANRDGLQHFDGIGANGWGLEDSFGLGDNDYDDMLVRFTIASTSEPTSAPLPTPTSQPTPVSDNRTRYNLIQGDNLNNKLKGTSKNDEIYGCVGRDKIKGRRGDDIIDPGLSKAGRFDIVRGSKGSDTFIIKDGYRAFIKDFNIIDDALDLSDLKGYNVSSWELIDNDTFVYSDDGHEVVKLKGKHDLSEANIII